MLSAIILFTSQLCAKRQYNFHAYLGRARTPALFT